jgi:hypothetical protein
MTQILKKIKNRIYRFLESKGWGKKGYGTKEDAVIINSTQPDSTDSIKRKVPRRTCKGKKYKVLKCDFAHFINPSNDDVEYHFLSIHPNISIVARKYRELKRTTMYEYFKNEDNKRTYDKRNYRVVEIDYNEY